MFRLSSFVPLANAVLRNLFTYLTAQTAERPFCRIRAHKLPAELLQKARVFDDKRG